MSNKRAHVKGVMNVGYNFELPQKKKFNGIGKSFLLLS